MDDDDDELWKVGMSVAGSKGAKPHGNNGVWVK